MAMFLSVHSPVVILICTCHTSFIEKVCKYGLYILEEKIKFEFVLYLHVITSKIKVLPHF